MNQLLNTIWGDTPGVRCIVAGKGMSHRFTTTNDVGIPSGKDVWFAIALFNSEERKAENVIASRAFYLDIDCKEGKYENVLTAGAALAEFCQTLEIPAPVTVRSGNGLHCYWILTEPVSPDRWHPIASALRLACSDLGLDSDHSITKDIARILRVPNTLNYKDPSNPKKVELVTDITTCTYAELEAALADYIYQVELAEQAKEANTQFTIEYTATPKDADKIAEACNQIAAFRDSRGVIPEPAWYAGLGVLALCTEGEGKAKEWSSGHSNYSERDTLRKLDRAREFAPTTCQKFADVNPDGCKGCPYAGKITSPIQLGETVTPITTEAQESGLQTCETGTVAPSIPPPLAPSNYEVGKEGVFILAKDDDGAIDRQRILEHPLWISRLMVGEDGTGTEIELSWINAEGKRRTAPIRQSMMAAPQTFESALRDRNIYFFWSIKTVLKYINDSVMHVARTQKEETVYGKFGFTDDQETFILGSDGISKRGRQQVNISSRIDRKRVALAGEKGTLADWRKATRLLDEPRLWMHRFTVLACLGAPLLALSGNEGSILSLAGESSGGKTTAANLGVAAYASPNAFTIDPQSTMKSFYEHWRQAGNLPVVVNEAATINPHILTNLALAAANGKARDTMTQDGRLNDSGGWQTLTIFTSNIHLMDLSEKVLTEASRRRILELSFTQENRLPLSLGRPINALLEKNYGIAGRLFMDYVMRHSEEVADLVHQRVETLQAGVDSVHRYNVWLIAAASVAAEIAEALDLIDFETADAIENAIKTLRSQAADTKTPEEKVTELIAAYTSEFQRDIGIKEMSNASAWHKEPFGSARGRYNQDKNRGIFEFCVPVKAFKTYALDHGVDGKSVDDYMLRTGRKEPVRIAPAGSKVFSYVIPWSEEV